MPLNKETKPTKPQLQNHSKRVRTPVVLLRSLSGKYPWEMYEPLYPPSNSYIVPLLFFEEKGFGIK